MPELEDRLSALTVDATSPDGRLRAWARGFDEIGLAFGHSAYRSYREDELAAQLNALATTVWTRFRRDYLEIVEQFLDGRGEDGDSDPDHEYQRRLGELTVTGWSPSDYVTATTRGLARWTFQISPETLDRCSEDAFIAEALGAARDAVATYRALTIVLTARTFGVPHRAIS